MLRRGEYSSARQRRFLGARASGQPQRNVPPALKTAHAAVERAYLSALKRKDRRTQMVLAKPWEAIESAMYRRNPTRDPDPMTVAGEMIARYGWRDALDRAERLAFGPYAGNIRGKWRTIAEAIKREAPAGVRKKNPRTRRTRSRNPAGDQAREMLAFTVRRAGHAVGHVVARSARAAAAEAKAAGLQLGREVKKEGLRRLCKSNPPQGATLSTRAEALTYQHTEDGEWYRHTWRPGVVVKVSPDKKRVTLYRPDGKPVAGNFFVP